MIDGVEQLETYFGQFLPQFLIALLSPLLIFAVVAFIDLPVALVMLGFALVALFAPALWHKFDVRNSQYRQRSYASFAAEFLDSIQGLATLKAFGQGKTRADKLEVEARDLFRRTMWVLGTNALARGITDTAIACGAATALIYGALRVESGAMALTSLLIILMLGVEIFRPMRELRTVLHQGMVGLSAAQGIYKILDDKPSVADVLPTPLDKALAPTIAFENIRFSYPGTRRTVHDGLSFRAEAGERLGLVGPSGGGKSSIVRLLLRFYDPDGGRITLGGHDLRTLSFEQIRSLISVVNQDTFLFHGTVEENIRLGKPDASQRQVEDAARAANIHEFILGLPQGYGTVIGEKGIKLSGGQRQRLAIARALLRDTPILVLDEALSAVDAENEAVIQEALDRLMQGRTTLILAHRLSSVIDCDRILVLDGGKVTEQGRHADLMSRGGVYAGLMAEQARESSTSATLDAFVTPARAESVSDTPGGAVKPLTEGIIKADGLTWYQVVAALMKVILPWKGKLTATFVLGVLRVIAFIGVGVLSALIVLALKNHEPWRDLRHRARPAGAAVGRAALAGIVDGARHGLPPAGRDAHRRLPQARRAGAGLSGASPHRRSDGAGHARHRAGRVFLRPHRGAGLRRHPHPGRRACRAGLGQRLAGAGAAALPACRWPQPLPDAQARRPSRLRGARGGGRARRLRRRFGAGPGRDRRLPAGGPARREAERAVAASHRPAPAVLPRAHPAARHPRDADRPGRPRRRRDRRGAVVAAARSIPACCRCSPSSRWRPSCRCRRSPRSAASSPTRWAPRGASMRWPTSRSRCATGPARRSGRARPRSRSKA